MSIHVLTREPLRRIARELAVIAVPTVVAVGTADAQQRPRSQADSSDPDARGTARQTVTPGGEESSRTRGRAPRGRVLAHHGRPPRGGVLAHEGGSRRRRLLAAPIP
jgi:hypothetical protein